MKKIMLSLFVLVLLLVSAFSTRLVMTVGGGSTTHHVYSGQSIQDAINSAQSGDTIFVHAGTYYERIVVRKAVSLIGENRYNTVIDGLQREGIFTIYGKNVSISGFTIRNSYIYTCAGIKIYNTSYAKISDNIIIDNIGVGVFIYDSCCNTVCDNIIMNNQHNGIFIFDPTGHGGWNLVRANSIINNSLGGVRIGWSNSNVIEGNVITDNWPIGIALTLAFNNTIKNNFINNNQAEVEFDDGSNKWDDGYPSGGNYWSDYKGTDLYSGPYQNETGSDGIGDTPRAIFAQNEDRYPLMNPPTLPDTQITYNDFYELLAKSWDLQRKYDNLTTSYNSLQADLEDLQSKQNSLTNELNNTRNTMYAILYSITVLASIIVLATTAYLALRKPKVKSEVKTT